MTPEVPTTSPAYDANVKIEPRRASADLRLGPMHDFYVVFWRQPSIRESELAAGATQEQIMWAASEYCVSKAEDVHQVIAWADEEARRRSAMYTLYAQVGIGEREGLVWLAGVDPTVHSRPNFERRHPADVDPVGGTSDEVYRPIEDS
jgi:hypothetical protein